MCNEIHIIGGETKMRDICNIKDPVSAIKAFQEWEPTSHRFRYRMIARCPRILCEGQCCIEIKECRKISEIYIGDSDFYRVLVDFLKDMEFGYVQGKYIILNTDGWCLYCVARGVLGGDVQKCIDMTRKCHKQ